MKRLSQVIFAYVIFASLLYLALHLYLSDKDEARLRQILLLDDGYVEIARGFVEQGGSLLHQEVGPGLPLLYIPIFSMPEKYHPVLRSCVTVAINVTSLIFLFLIMRRLGSNDGIFTLAAALLIINPVFIHWTIKSAPDSLIAALLLIFTHLVLRRGRCWIAALLVHFASLFVRPTALFVPIPLLIGAAVRREKPLALFSIILLIFSATGYWLNNQMTVQPGMDALTTYSSGLHEIVMDAFFVDNVIQTKRFNTGSLDDANGNRPLAHGQYWTWLRANRDASDDRFTLLMKFVRQHPRLLAQKMILNPLFFISMCSTPVESWMTLFSNAALILLAALHFARRGVRDETVLLSIVAGYFLIFWIGHSYSRYMYGILPLLSIFAASAVHPAMERKMKTNMRERQSHANAAQNEPI